MADDSRFDAEQLLDLSKAHVVEGGSIGLDKNRLVTLRWDVSLGAGETCRRWLESNRRTLSDFTAEQKSYEGKWRTLKVTTETGRSKQRENVIVEHTLAYGLITKLVTAGSVDWSESTWALESRILLGNTTDADSEESTDTDVPQKHLYIRFPFIDPRKVHEIAASFSATTYTTPIVDGEEVSGTFHRIAVNIRKEDDGTCSLILYLADPQYTLAAYRDYKTTQHRGVYYLWGVPRDIAQSILDDWKTENDDATDRTGASASASERSDGLVDLVLISEPLFKENLSTDPIPVACDTSIVYHFAWGYSKTELGVFLAAHSGTLGSGLTREVQVNHRSDGTFDATIVERTLTYDEDKHLFTVSTVSGTGITRSKSYGWNLPMSVLETIKAVYESPAEGKTSSFDVRREDDCTFDYVAEIIFTSAIQRDMETAGTGGVQEKVISGRNLHDSDLTALEATLTPAARKRVQMDVQVQQDDTSNVTVKETTVQEVTGESTDDGNGILTVGSVGRNVDLVDLADIVTSAARKRHSISLSANDDGTFNYAVTEQTLKESEESSTSTGSAGIDTVGTVGRNVAAASLAGIVARAARKRHSLSLSANDDGTFNYVVVEQIVELVEGASTDTGDGIITVGSVGRNVDVSSLTNLIQSAARKRHSINISANDDGTFNYSVTEQTLQEIEESSTSTGSVGINTTGTVGRNVDADALAGIVTRAARKRHSLSISANDDGTFNFTVIEQTVEEVTGESTDIGDGILTTAATGRNVDEVDLVGIVTSAARKRHSVSLSANDDGTFNYTVTEQELKASTESSTSSGSVGVDTTGTVGRNVDAAALVNIITRAARKRHSLSLSANDDGTFNYTVVEQTVEHVEGASTDSGDTGLNDQGIPTTGAIGRNVDLTDLAGIIACAARKRHSLSLSANDDNTFNYAVTEQELREAVAANVDAGNGIVTTASSGRNVDASAIEDLVTSAPRKRHTINISPNDDNTFNYSVTEQELQLVTGEILDTGNGIVTTAQTGRNVDAGDLVGIVVSAARKRHSVSLSANDDGTFNYSVTEQTVQEVEGESTDTGDGIIITGKVGRNVDEATLTGLIASAARKRHSLNVLANDDGTFNYAITEQTLQESKETTTSTGTAGIDTVGTVARNVDASELSGILARAARKRHSVSLSANDDGTFNYTVIEQTVEEITHTEMSTAGTGGSWTAITGRNVDAADLAGNITTTSLSRVSLNLSANDDGTLNYSGSVLTVVATEAEGAISDSGDTGIARDIHIGNNVTPAQFASMVNGLSSTATKDYQVNASADDYGNISYVVRSEEQQAGEGSVAVADDGTHGIAVTAKTGNIVTQADLNTLAASLAAGARKHTQISLTALPAGGFRYSAQQSEAQATTDQFTVGTVSRITTVDIGTNQDEPPIVPVPAIGRVVSVSAQHADDGTINYRIDSSERVGVPTDQSTHGSYAQRVTKDKTEGDNAVPSDAPSIGESHFINFDINDDGTVDWDRTTITRVEMEHSLALSHRIPSVESEGVTDTATVFNGVLVADIPGAAGTYFYFSEFSINDDFTFSGVLHDLTYVATPDTDPFTIAQGSYTAEETQFDQVYGDKREGKLWLNSLMRVINYEISYTITRSGTAALIAMSGGELRGSSLDRVTINGQSYWRAVRLSLTYVNSWQHIDRVEITTSPTYTP